MNFLRWQPLFHLILLVTIGQRPVQLTNKQNKRANWDRTSRRVLIKSQWSDWDSNPEPSSRHRPGGGALYNWAVNRLINNGNDFLWQQPTKTTFLYFAKLVPEQRGQRNKNSLKTFLPTHILLQSKPSINKRRSSQRSHKLESGSGPWAGQNMQRFMTTTMAGFLGHKPHIK